MKNATGSPGTSPLTYFLLVFALAVPFLVIGAVTGIQLLPGLPVSALMAVCPATAALIVAYRDDGAASAKALLKRAFDFRRVKGKIWYAPVLLLMPGVMALSFGVIRWSGTPVPVPQIAVVPTLILCVVFFTGAVAEELGWSGYVIDPIQNRCGALWGSLLVGLVWAVFHYAALLQDHRSLVWIGWWSLWTVASRVIIVWLYNNTGKSVFAAALFHTTINVTWQLFPIQGSFFNPRVTGVITTLVAATVIVVWGPRTLARRAVTLH
ncbi:MAG: CPBP family intramembrane glutamic endopeptidase [Candidatus Acidiferrales bacterium]